MLWLIVMLNILSNLTAVNVPDRVLITWIRSSPDIRMLSNHWKWYCRNLLTNIQRCSEDTVEQKQLAKEAKLFFISFYKL